MQNYILIPGAPGTIGRRLARGAKDSNIPIVAVLNSGRIKHDLHGNPILFDKALITDGPNLDERVQIAVQSGQLIHGKIGQQTPNSQPEIDWSEVSVIADTCHKRGTRENMDTRYKNNIPLLVQGGSAVLPEDQLEHFVATPYSNAENLFTTDNMQRLKQVSCNATGLSQIIGNVAKAVGSPLAIESMKAKIERRFADEEDEGKKYDPSDVKFDSNAKYGKDVGLAMTYFENVIKAVANKNPWRSHHLITAEITLNRPYNIGDIQESFKQDNAIISVNKDPIQQGVERGLQYITQTSANLGVPYGDIPLNVAYAARSGPRRIQVKMAVAQRWSAMPSTWTALFGMADIGQYDKCDTLDQAMDRVNSLPLAYGKTFPEMKAMHEEKFNKQRNTHVDVERYKTVDIFNLAT